MNMKTYLSSKLMMVLAVSLLFSCGGGNEDDDMGGGGVILPSMAINSLSLFEGDSETTFEFKVRLSAAYTQEVSVDYSTVAGSAMATDDYEATSGSLTFAPNEVEQFIEVKIIADTLREGDEEFKVQLSNPVNATLTTAEGTAVIRNDDTFLATDCAGYITPDSYAGMTLVWRDEFNGSQIDAANWTHEMGGSGWGNNELQYYTDRATNSFVQDGKLIIEAREEAFSGRDYTSARMISKDKQEFAFGRIDIRAKLPKGQGIWPALWMLGANFGDVGWPACGELDIMELIGSDPQQVHGTAHWGPQGSSTSQSAGHHIRLSTDDFSTEFNVFSIIWESNSVKWYMNDMLYHSINTGSVGSNNYPFNQEFFFILNVAVGGNWPGNPNASTNFPQQMQVDYIRVFQ